MYSKQVGFGFFPKKKTLKVSPPGNIFFWKSKHTVYNTFLLNNEIKDMHVIYQKK